MKSRLKSNLPILLFLGILFLSQFAFAAAGDLDTTFGGTGKLRVKAGGGRDNANAMARQTDGKIIVAGSGDEAYDAGFSLVRYNVNGTLDTTFGNGGKVITVIGSLISGANAVTILADGKILAAGYAATGFGQANSDFALVKYNSNGTLDTTFGTGGIVTTNFLNDSDIAYAIAVQADGKIVLAGEAAFSSTFSFGALARYTAGGALDTTFDGDGKVTTAYNESAHDTAIVIFNGRFYVSGEIGSVGMGSRCILTSYNSDGSLNAAFDGDGIAYLPIPSNSYNYNTASSLAVLGVIAGEEKIIVAGSISGTYILERQTLWSYDAYNGALDNSFGTGGRMTLNVDRTTGRAIRILNSNGVASRIVVAGTKTTVTGAVTSSDYLIARYQLNGALDTAFNGSGIAVADISTFDEGAAMLIQPTDDKIVVAGNTYSNILFGNVGNTSDTDFGIVRFNTNGSLDTTFSGDGKRAEDVSNTYSGAAATLVQTDGKIVVAGANIVARFNTNGSFDTTFDEDGKTKIPVCCIAGAVIQPDGKIVLAVSVSTNYSGFPNYFAAYRLNTDGSPDNTFDGDGLASAEISGDISRLTAIAIQPDGGIVLAGYTNVGSNTSPNYDFSVVRFLPNGALDTSFDSDGKVTTAIGLNDDAANAVVVQPNGKIVVAGFSGNNTDRDFALVRYNANGSLDTSFSGDGKLTTSIATGFDAANAVALQTDGKIIAAGYAYNGTNNDFAAARYNADGALDTTFDGDGKLTTPIGSLNDFGNAVAVQNDNKILIAGSTETPTNTADFAVVRYNADGSLDSSNFAANKNNLTDTNSPLYGSGGKVVIDLSGGNDTASAIALDASGRAIVAGGANGLFGIVRLLNAAPTAASVSVSGRVLTADGRGLMNAVVSLTDASGNTRTTRTSTFGYYRFDEIAAGQTCVFNVQSKRYQFNPQVFSVVEDLTELNFTAIK